MSIIDEKLAKAFLDDPDNVDLSEATEITDGAAELLAEHVGVLYLDGLKELSDAAAESLSKHQGDLSIGRHPGAAGDGNQIQLSHAAAKSLSSHKSWPSIQISLGFDHPVVRWFAEFKKTTNHPELPGLS